MSNSAVSVKRSTYAGVASRRAGYWSATPADGLFWVAMGPVPRRQSRAAAAAAGERCLTVENSPVPSAAASGQG